MFLFTTYTPYYTPVHSATYYYLNKERGFACKTQKYYILNLLNTTKCRNISSRPQI